MDLRPYLKKTTFLRNLKELELRIDKLTKNELSSSFQPCQLVNKKEKHQKHFSQIYDLLKKIFKKIGRA